MAMVDCTDPTASYQDKLYAAESWAGLDHTSRRYPTIREARARVYSIITSDWYIDRYGELSIPRPMVERIRSRRVDGVTQQHIGIGLQALTDSTIVHELAHWVTPGEGHSRAFATELLALVREFMGFVAWADLCNGLERVGYWG